MDLFTVSCITCRAKLTVKQLSAIGQILPCPKCGGMVQIAPPKGWKPPATPPAAAATPTNTAARAPQASSPQAARGEGAGEVYTAQLADDDPLARPRSAATPAERRARLAVYGVVVTASLALVAYAAWSALKSPADPDVASVDPDADATGPSPTATGAAPARTDGTPSGTGLKSTGLKSTGSTGTGLSHTGPATIASTPGPIATAPASSKPGAVPPVGMPSSSAMLLVAAPSATAASPPATMPSATAAAGPPATSPTATSPTATSPTATSPTATSPTATAAPLTFPPVAGATPSGPAALPAATGPFAMPAAVTGPLATGSPAMGKPAGTTDPGATPTVDIAARLQEKVPALGFEKTPLRGALAVAAELAGVPIRYDWSTLPLDFRIDEPVSLTLSEAKLGDVLDGLTRERGLRVAAGEGAIVIAGPDSAPAAPQTVDHPIDDLFGTDESAAESAGKLVRAMVAPDTWHAPVGGSIAAAPGRLVISHLPRVQEEAKTFLNRLRAARGKPPRAAGNGGAIAPPAETRVSRVRKLLEQPVTMNFRPGAPLPAVVDYVEEATKARIVVDYGTLAAAGYSVEEPIGISAQENRLAEVLDALCRPRAWGWHMPRDGVIELTSLEAARGRTYVEFYDVRPLVAELTAEEFTARVIEATPDLGWNDAGGRTGMGFDQPSGRLIVRQTIGGHLQLERLIEELTPRPAGAAPAASGPTPTGVPGPAGR